MSFSNSEHNDDHDPTHDPQRGREEVGEGLQSLVSMLKVLFAGLRFLIVIVIAYAIFGGIFTVDVDSEVMLFRFGKLIEKEIDGEQRETLTSGHIYWAYPKPIDEKKTIVAQKSMSLATNHFWPPINPNKVNNSAPEPPPTSLRPGETGYLLSGDANIMHMIWSITYRIHDAKRYYLDFYEDPSPEEGDKPLPPRGVEVAIECALQNAVLLEVSGWSVEEILDKYKSVEGVRLTIDDAVELRMQRVIKNMNLGIEIQKVNLVESQPPAAVREAFTSVTQAAQEYQTEINKALQYETVKLNESRGMAAEIRADALAYKTRIVEKVKAQADTFTKLNEKFDENADGLLVALYTDAIEEVLGKIDKKYIVHANDSGKQEIRLLLGPVSEKKNQPKN